MRPRANESRPSGARHAAAGHAAALTPAVFDAFRNWRRGRIVKRSRLDAGLWASVVGRYPFTRALDSGERERLRAWVILFLRSKSIVAAGGALLRRRNTGSRTLRFAGTIR